MKKLLFLLCLFFQFAAFGQQTLIGLMNDQITASGCGIAHFLINYSSGKYNSQEVAIISEDSVNSANVSIHIRFQDTSRTRTDTTFILNNNQLSTLQSFYQSAGSNSNPCPSVTAKDQGTVSLKGDVGCAGTTCVTYNSNLHISLYRSLIYNWNNWYQ